MRARPGLMESPGYVSETLPFILKTLLTPLGLMFGTSPVISLELVALTKGIPHLCTVERRIHYLVVWKQNFLHVLLRVPVKYS